MNVEQSELVELTVGSTTIYAMSLETAVSQLRAELKAAFPTADLHDVGARSISSGKVYANIQLTGRSLGARCEINFSKGKCAEGATVYNMPEGVISWSSSHYTVSEAIVLADCFQKLALIVARMEAMWASAWFVSERSFEKLSDAGNLVANQ